MVVQYLYLLFILTYILLPFFYKCRRTAMLDFYLRMTFSRSFRKCYSLGLLAQLMVFHFYYLNVFGNVYELALSSLLCLLLYSHKHMERAFNFLQHKRRLFLMMLAAISLLFTTHMLPVGVTLGTLIFGAMFYPSTGIRTASDEKLESYLENPLDIVEDYYNWNQ